MNEVKVLIIDDNQDDCVLYKYSLKQAADTKYTTDEAYNGDDGLNKINETVGCILLDYSLPGYNGIDVLKRIRAKHPFIPVVMLTGQGNETVAVAAMKEGAQDYITKDKISHETLQRVIRTAIEHSTLEKRINDQHTSLEIFTRALAHDLKEPMRTIRCFMDLIVASGEKLSEKNRDNFLYVCTAAERMQKLVDTVFSYTSLESLKGISRENCDVAVLLSEVEDNLNHLISDRKTTIHSAKLPTLMAHRVHLQQVFQNLIANAINHSKDPVNINITATEQGEQWLFEVKDNGPGIEAEYIEQIFEPFKRLTSQNDSSGAGLGLAICRKIIESHGGKIWCKSEPGKGATFVFTLPKAVKFGNYDA